MGIMEGSPIPETYAGPRAWWDPAEARNAVIIDRDMTGEEALRLAGIDWTVEKRPLVFDAMTEGHEPGEQVVTPWMATVRKTDDRYLGIVKPSYREFQNAEGAEFMDTVLGRSGAHYHTSGSLYDGALVWLLAKFDEDLHVHGDGSPIESYLLGIWGHDGIHALQAVPTNVRVWCGNTADAALTGATRKAVIRHTAGMTDKLAEVAKALDVTTKYRDRWVDVMNTLADRPMTIDDVRAYTIELFPTTPDVEKPYRTEARRDAIADLFAASENLVDMPQNAYRAFQATVEHLDHGTEFRDTRSGAAADRKALSMLEGDLDRTKSRAVSLLVKA